MSSTSSPKSKAHGFSALSTAFGVALTLGVLGLVVAGALVVRDLKAAWLSSMAVEVVLNEEGGQSAEEWESLWAREPGVASVRFISAGEASAELEAELGEPFMDFLGQSPLPAMVLILRIAGGCDIEIPISVSHETRVGTFPPTLIILLSRENARVLASYAGTIERHIVSIDVSSGKGHS